jgi:hypothetical protein
MASAHGCAVFGSLAFPVGALNRVGVQVALLHTSGPASSRSRGRALVISRRETLSRSFYLASRPDPLLGFPKMAPPSTSKLRVHSRASSLERSPSPARPRFGPPLPEDGSRSTFAVSHRLDGFLHGTPRGFVAPRCRSWGSPRFRPFVVALASSLVQAVPDGASTLRSLVLDRSRLPFACLPSGEILPSCRSAPLDGSGLALPWPPPVPAFPFGPVGAEDGASNGTSTSGPWATRRIRSSRPAVSSRPRALLPWVSASVR